MPASAAAIVVRDGESPVTVSDPLDALPERMFAARMPEPEPERPLPFSRRAIFFDVENSSRPEHISRVIEHLAVDRVGRRTDFVAVGNWRVVGTDTARLLARHGAQLAHSAPATGVRDWSDLRIAVAAGVWLASARPGDVVEIVSDDRAFDAVGDVAASLGIAFRRLSYRGLVGLQADAVPERETEMTSSSQRRRHGRRRGGSGTHGPRPVPASVVQLPRPASVGDGDEARAEHRQEQPHTAPHDEIVAVVRDLARSGRLVTLDSLANALKSRGFSRPPGSPRLITRLRRIREVTVSRSGVITLVGSGSGDRQPHRRPDDDVVATLEASSVAAPEPVHQDLEVEAVVVGPSQESSESGEDSDAPEPGNERFPVAPQPGQFDQTSGPRRRRSRRGGRRHRSRRPQGAAAPAAG
jgi:hypothetical protein